MSCDWDVKCLDCDECAGFDSMNHEDETMRILIRHAKAIAALAEPKKALPELELNTGYQRGFVRIEWFAKHAEHRLRPIDEYGELDGECGEGIPCPTCGAEHRCIRPKDHAGECSFDEK